MDDFLTLRIVMFVVMMGSGVLLMWMARAAASGRLKRNSIAGIRTPSTMLSDETWLAAHVRAKRPTILAGIAAVATGLIALVPMPEVALATTVLVGCAVILGFVLYGARVGSRAAVEPSDRSAG